MILRSGKLVLFALVVLLAGGIIYHLYTPDQSMLVLNGTFLNEDDPTMSFAFDARDNSTFYYSPSDTSAHEIGTYSATDNSVYVLNSKSLKNVKLKYTGDRFTIRIDDAAYTFRKTSDVPIIQDN